MKRINGSDVWTDGVAKYKRNARNEFEIYNELNEDCDDNWTYSDKDFVTLDEPVVLKPVKPNLE